MYTVFSLTLRQLTGSRRQAILWLFAALPAAFALLLRYLTDDYSAQIINLFDLLLVAIVLPLVVAILATTALGEEVEDRTLAFIVLRPVPKWQIILAKYGAVVILAALPLLIFGAVTAGIAFIDDASGESVFDYETVIKPILGVVAGTCPRHCRLCGSIPLARPDLQSGPGLSQSSTYSSGRELPPASLPASST